MTWSETSKLAEKKRFIDDYLTDEFDFSELCDRYNISRPTGYELIGRFYQEGISAVNPKSRAPHNHPNQTPSHIVNKLLELKYRYPNWGPATIREFLLQEKIKGPWPAASTIGEIFKKHGLVKPRYKRKHAPAHSEPLRDCKAPNDIWSADFKGQFRLSNGKYCYPLTITDNFSRYLLACKGLYSIALDEAKKCFETAFKEYGLPKAIRTDNGYPFAGVGIGGLTPLSIWLLKLGVMPERIAKGRPEQNGRHERMHRTLKAATIVPYTKNIKEQQRCFNKFKREFNHLRPHQALNGKRPGQVYQCSRQEMPRKLQEVIYPSHFNIRKVKSRGDISFAGKLYYVSELLYGEPVGLEMIDEDRAILYFAGLKLGMLDVRSDKIKRP